MYVSRLFHLPAVTRPIFCDQNLDLDFSYHTPLCLDSVVLPRLQRLRLHAKKSETPELTDILIQFFADHPLLIKLTSFLYRDYTSSLTPSSLPNLVEVFGSPELIEALASSDKARNPQRPLKSIKTHAQDIMDILERSGENLGNLKNLVLIGTSRLTLDDFAKLGRAFPNLENLELEMYDQFAASLVDSSLNSQPALS